MKKTTQRQIASLNHRKGLAEQYRDELIARLNASDHTPTCNDIFDAINRQHDAIYDIEQEIRQLEIGPVADRGDWNDRASAHHY